MTNRLADLMEDDDDDRDDVAEDEAEPEAPDNARSGGRTYSDDPTVAKAQRAWDGMIARRNERREQQAQTNGAPQSPDDWTLKARIESDAEAADHELEWRMKGREHFKPIISGIADLLSALVDGGLIEDVEIKHYEPGEYGESGDVFYPERIEFSWRKTGDDHRYSNVPDYSITLVSGTLQ